MSQQNPTIPTATQAKGISAVVNDLQTHLSFELSWLTEGMGRCYKLQRVRSNGSIEFKPMVYLGTSIHDYHAAVPDNDNTGQSVILVGDGVPTNQKRGFYSLYEYPVSIIFSANLNTIDSTLLLTEDFTEHLMDNVRQALVRDLLGKYYQLEIVSETRQFEDVYSEFDVNEGTAKTSKPLLPMTYFRFNCVVRFDESCPSAPLDRCTAILQNLTSADLLTCILPTYDFSTAAVQDASSAQQKADMTTWLCAAAPSYTNTHSLLFDGINDKVLFPDTSGFFAAMERTQPFFISAWIKISAWHDGIIFSKGNYITTSVGTRFLCRADGSLFLSLHNSGTNRLVVTSPASILPLNTWCYVSVSYTGNSADTGVTFTLNGVEQANVVSASPVTASILNAFDPVIGDADNSIFPFTGYMTEPRMWSVAQNVPFALAEYGTGTPTEAQDKLNSVFLPRFGEDAMWNDLASTLNWRIKDDSNIAAESFQTDNIAKTGRQTDIPI